ncbi:MAG TPA: DNA-formamidopyrimidine glycosylase family protein [Parafilimonas sp.]|nr:DNA-formamidopyrimidine glycosylase family protein [Parafilimonas sp.]
MPEGPSIVILKEQVRQFKGKKILDVAGNSKIEYHQLHNKKVIDFKSWGKHFLICCKGITLRVHFMLFGSYRINERKATPARLSLQFDNGELNLYACSVKLFTEDPDELYDWSADVMNDAWDPSKARQKLKQIPETIVADALLNQNIFSGVGNIIKNEVLFRIRVHPKTKVGDLPSKKLSELIKEARNYSFDFLEWKKAFVLKKHWLIHTKKICPRCNIPVHKEHVGKTNRRTFFCENCQVLYQGII